jgi:hypothetical protein
MQRMRASLQLTVIRRLVQIQSSTRPPPGKNWRLIMLRASFIAVTASAVLVTGCASNPRSFAPVLAAAPADEGAFQQVLASCQEIAAQSGGGRSGRLTSAGAGIAGGAGAAAVGTAATAGTYSSYGAAAAAGSALIVTVPIIGLGAAWGLARINRGNKERRINQAAQDCLATEGYAVTSWERARDRQPEEEPVDEPMSVAPQEAGKAEVEPEGRPEDELVALTTL